jgi:hypothetical protein
LIKDVRDNFETEAEATILRDVKEKEKMARIAETDVEGVCCP